MDDDYDYDYFLDDDEMCSLCFMLSMIMIKMTTTTTNPTNMITTIYQYVNDHHHDSTR